MLHILNVKACYFLVLAGTLFAVGCQSSGGTVARIQTLDFQPATGGSFDASCPGTLLSYANVKHYQPTVVLEQAAPAGFTCWFYAMEDRSWWPDTELAWFSAHFSTGSTTPDVITVNNIQPTTRLPDGAPAQTIGTFWLGCTMQCRVRGNTGRGDDAAANVYLELASLFQPDDPSVDMDLFGVSRSPTHTVRCE